MSICIPRNYQSNNENVTKLYLEYITPLVGSSTEF